MLKNLEGFFEYVGSPQSGSIAAYEEVYEDLLTSLYQLDDDGNKVIIDWNTDSNRFVIDVNKPVYVGSLRDNSDSNFVAIRGKYNGNCYNDIVNLGFKPTNHYEPQRNNKIRSFIIDAEEDSVLPISYYEESDRCSFSNNLRALCLPKVNFYIYEKYNKYGVSLPVYNGYYGIKRNGYEIIGNYEYQSVSERTGAIDLYGNIIHRYKVSVLMLPINNADSSKFKLLGHSDGNYGSEYDVEIEEYSFDSSVDYGQEVNANGVYGIVHVNFVNADSNHADLVPTDSCQFLGIIYHELGNVSSKLQFGNRWNDKCNDIYCKLNGSFRIIYAKKKYIVSSINFYIDRAFLNGLYNTKFINKDKSMYLYNVENALDGISIENTIDLSVKRLPVINLTGKVSKSDFDSSKTFIYIIREDITTGYGVLLCKYADLDSDLILQCADNTGSYNYRKLSKETSFIIYSSSTEPNDSWMCNKNDGNATDVYKLVCQPTEMNKEVKYTLTKL